ncbi:hypothetical protein [Geobacter sp. DSM 9736]|uniref:hypothetical protein n=1 Tax=Geobacter sp. DSM 9736 TaxID=1277350 RepID=UPI000B50702E|nr:hypothetical protein [Geobacter sp. DSM 9736]SNB44772.1 hypothetical protein SAMN06269301_0159 [Geobacter sp. DSM 9736]
MYRTLILAAALSLTLAFPAFAAESSKPAKGGADVHGEKGAKPGSHEDWCSEHGVAESQCTRCDKSLIPAFKATDDWCKQHGLPKSQCKKCDPKLKIVRPPKGSK